MKSIADWTTEIHGLAKEKGWYNPPKTDGEFLLLVHSEVSEAVEELRKKRPLIYQYGWDGEIVTAGSIDWRASAKPEGQAVELADAVIRIMDWFGHKGLDLEKIIDLKHKYNKTRSTRHGGKII